MPGLILATIRPGCRATKGSAPSMTRSRRNYQRRQDGGSASPRPADNYQQVTDRIIAGLEAGTVPWRRPWRTAGGMPRSMSTGRRYQGVSVMLLAMTAADRGYTSSWWSTLSRDQRAGRLDPQGAEPRERQRRHLCLGVARVRPRRSRRG